MTKYYTLSISMDEKTHKVLEALQEKRYTSKSATVRQILHEEFERVTKTSTQGLKPSS